MAFTEWFMSDECKEKAVKDNNQEENIKEPELYLGRNDKVFKEKVIGMKVELEPYAIT